MSENDPDWVFYGRRLVQTGNLNHNNTLILEKYIDNGLKNIVTCGFGVGLSCASSFLKLNK